MELDIIPNFAEPVVVDQFSCSSQAIAALYAHAAQRRLLYKAALAVYERCTTHSLLQLIRLLRSIGIDARTAAEVGGLPLDRYAQYVLIPWCTAIRYLDISKFWLHRGYVVIPFKLMYGIAKQIYQRYIVDLVGQYKDVLTKWYELNPHAASWLESLGVREERPRVVREVSGDVAPCVREAIEALKRGENISHSARFLIATYLIHSGWDVEQIVDLFRHAPDFNEKITRYQVMHIAGQVGGRKRYSVPSCETVKSWGLCVADCRVRSPAAFISSLKKDQKT